MLFLSLVSLVIWSWIRGPLFLLDPNKPHQEVNNVAILAKKNLFRSPFNDPEGCNPYLVSLAAFCRFISKFSKYSLFLTGLYVPTLFFDTILSIFICSEYHDVFKVPFLGGKYTVDHCSTFSLVECQKSICFLLHSFDMSEVSNQLPTEPISAVGVITSPSKAPDGHYVVSNHSELS